MNPSASVAQWRGRVRPSGRSLRTKLVAAVVGLFLAITVATSTGLVLAMRHYLLQQVDRDLENIARRIEGPGRLDPDDIPGPRPGGGPPGGAGASVTVRLRDGKAIASHFESGTAYGELSAEQVEELQDASLGPKPKTVSVDGLGRLRAMASRNRDGDTVIVGISTEGMAETLSTATSLMVGGTIVGLVLVSVGGLWLVRRNLAPLERVAHTATRVSRLKLDEGDVALAERVPEEDTDPRTEVGQVGRALNNLLDNVEGALQSRHESEQRVRQFVADASHELRTPLATIRGYAELSRREREPVPVSVAHALGRVESEALRMQGLVEDLLLLARIDAGRPLEREPVDLSRLAVDAVGDAHAAAPDHQWELDVPEQPVEVVGDRARLHQVVANLLANARMHTPPGTCVVTAVDSTDGWVRIRVRDNGPGIPEALQRNVFQRFTRGDDSRSRAAGSTGLGLSIVDAVASSHGGRVELESRPGDTSFTVLLPAR